MKNTLLGIKIIGWMFILSFLTIGITRIPQHEYMSTVIVGGIGFLLGFNLLRRKEGARELVVFLSGLVIIFTLIGMFVVPYWGIKIEERVREKQNYYEKQSAYLKKLQDKDGNREEINKVKSELIQLKDCLDENLEFGKKWRVIYESFELNRFTIIGICFQIFVVYYFTRPYVKKQFE